MNLKLTLILLSMILIAYSFSKLAQQGIKRETLHFALPFSIGVFIAILAVIMS